MLNLVVQKTPLNPSGMVGRPSLLFPVIFYVDAHHAPHYNYVIIDHVN